MAALTDRSLLPVAFSGAPGAYSEEAARRFFGQACPTLTCGSPDEALAAVAGDAAGYAVLPVENALTGCFDGVVEPVFAHEVGVAGEVVLTLRHCLLAIPGARLDGLAVVTSHPSALAQCRDWLASWGVATRSAPDTARAASDLASTRDAALGVLGSRSLAERYGLSILAEGIADRPDNRTRFLVFSSRAEARPPALRSALAVGPTDAPRILKTLRIQLEALGARRARAPFLGSVDGARFLIEFDHASGRGEELARTACGAVPYRFLGSWGP